MAAPLTDAQRKDLVDLYLSGVTIDEIAKRVGVSKGTVFRVLKREGVKASRHGAAPPDGVLEAFQNGESVYSIARRVGVSRNVVDRWVRDAGLAHRGCSEAGLLRAASMTPEQRAAQAAAAHKAALGRKPSPEESVRRAITVERQARDGLRKPSSGESLMLEWLADAGLDCTFQKAVWRYNIDIAVGEHLGVEILGGGWHAMKDRRVKEARRLEELLSCGWNIVYVWNTSSMPMTEWCAEQVVSLYKVTSAFPTDRGQYWVVRGDGKLTAFCGDYADERALVLPSEARK